MVTAKDIIERGYFPKELPPPFSSKSLADHFQEIPKSNAKDSYCLRYSYSKYATVRRTLSIPNPAHFCPLAEEIAKCWPDLQKFCSNSPFSKTTPKEDAERAIIWENSLDKIPEFRVEQRVGARYVLQADVSAFYSSIYTHTIPWALDEKDKAKSFRKDKKKLKTLKGNLLDCLSRNIQSGQTIGIPIGPDTSLPIGEIILTAVDIIVKSNFPKSNLIKAFRFIDDYEFVCDSISDAEFIRNVLQNALAEYELQLNPRKTRIIELPNILDTHWVQDLSAFQLESDKPNVLHSQMIRYFSRAFELTRDNPGEPVLKYAVRRASEIDCKKNPELVHLLQRLLFQVAVVDPGTLQTALYITFEHRKHDLPVDSGALKRALTAIICHHSLLQHGGDIAWALWGAVVFDILLEEDAICELEKITDPIAILMAFFTDNKGKCAKSLNRANWEHIVTQDELFESRWLVAYEAFGQDWFPNITEDPAKDDPFFAEARKKGVKFIDLSTPLKIPAPSPIVEYA